MLAESLEAGYHGGLTQGDMDPELTTKRINRGGGKRQGRVYPWYLLSTLSVMFPTPDHDTLLTFHSLQALKDCGYPVLVSISIFHPAYLSTHSTNFIILEVQSHQEL